MRSKRSNMYSIVLSSFFFFIFFYLSCNKAYVLSFFSRIFFVPPWTQVLVRTFSLLFLCVFALLRLVISLFSCQRCTLVCRSLTHWRLICVMPKRQPKKRKEKGKRCLLESDKEPRCESGAWKKWHLRFVDDRLLLFVGWWLRKKRREAQGSYAAGVFQRANRQIHTPVDRSFFFLLFSLISCHTRLMYALKQ